MRASLVVTVIGPDRTGLVESIASIVAEHGGNWVESRMSRLAGQFAGILLVDVDRDRRDALAHALQGLDARGLHTVVEPAEPDAAPPPSPEPLAFRFELLGHDRPGIVRDVSRVLAQRHVNVVDLETEVASAPMTGEPLFRARIEVSVPGHDALDTLRDAIESVADTLAMDVTFD